MPSSSYAKLDPSLIRTLRSIAGDANVITDREQMDDYSHDEF